MWISFTWCKHRRSLDITPCVFIMTMMNIFQTQRSLVDTDHVLQLKEGDVKNQICLQCLWNAELSEIFTILVPPKEIKNPLIPSQVARECSPPALDPAEMEHCHPLCRLRLPHKHLTRKKIWHLDLHDFVFLAKSSRFHYRKDINTHT